jgi:hypothetical protein
VRAPKKEPSVARKGPDGRSQLLVYMQPDLIRKLKLAALALGVPSYELAEKAIDEWLKKNQRKIREGTAEISRGSKQ